MERHTFPPAAFPASAPNSIQPTPEQFRFDPGKHLQLGPPEYIKMLPTDSGHEQFVQFPIPPSGSGPRVVRGCSSDAEVPFTGLAYTAPFRVLSDQGVSALRQVIDNNEKFTTSVPNLVPKCLRGLGYRSDFIRDLNYSEPLLRHLSQCAGEALTPHAMSMNLAQINFGEIGGGPVNQWHIDSVPYVMVILLSDATDMVGGELLVARLGDPKEAIRRIRAEEIDPQLIDKVNYPGPGYAIFMQGSQIAHAVTPVTHAKERRLTCINSYQTLNPFCQDHTVYKTFTTMDGDAPPYEFARHVAWRVQGQLDYLMNKVVNGSSGHEELEAILDKAASELSRAKLLITGKIEDEQPYDINGKAAAEATKAIEAYGTAVTNTSKL